MASQAKDESIVDAVDTMPRPSVPEFYAHKTILITGATGFVGKVLVEKLLRACPDVGTVYLLLRKKKGQSPDERLKAFILNPLFEPLRKANPGVLEKLRLIPGDILDEDLGLSNDDRRELQSNCNIVFHSAACVRFDQKIKDAVELNVKGTLKVLQLAETIKNLEVLVHLSTAYCRCELPALEEKIYPAQHPPHSVMEMCEWMDNSLLEHLEPKLIDTEPNTYSYTKAMTESLVENFSHKFPIAIARPSIVTAIWQEPIPGWVDNFNGPTGMLIGAGKGVIRTMHCEPTYQADAMPVDVVANGCLLIGYATVMDKPSETRVYNITMSRVIKMTWGEIIERGKRMVNENPYLVALWYPGGNIKSYKWTNQISVVFTHYLPAYCVDFVMLLLGKGTFLVKLQDRISHGLEILQHYTVKEWHFKNDNYKALRNRISEQDNKLFYTDVSTLDIDSYLRHYVLGSRLYCCKEDPATLPQARKLHRLRYIADMAVRAVFYCLIAWFIYSYIHVFTSALGYLDTALSSISPFSSAKGEEFEI